MNRRAFLLLRTGRRGQQLVICGERLCMHYVDSLREGTTDRLFQHVAENLWDVSTVRLSNEAWLASTGLDEWLRPLLTEFRERGGRIESSQP